MLLCLEMSALASLRREESRGGFYRRDFPYTDNDRWCANTVIFSRDGEPSLRLEEPVSPACRLLRQDDLREAVAAGTASLRRGRWRRHDPPHINVRCFRYDPGADSEPALPGIPGASPGR